MKDRKNRYEDMERKMLVILAVLVALFVLFLVASGNGITWLKAICAIVAIFGSLLCLIFLYLSDELLKQRSLWISTALTAIVICTLFSLILHFPCPKP